MESATQAASTIPPETKRKWWLAVLMSAFAAIGIAYGDRPSTQALENLHAGGLDAEQSSALMNRLIDQQAFIFSANDIFLASALLFVLLIAVVWLARPPQTGDSADAAAGAH